VTRVGSGLAVVAGAVVVVVVTTTVVVLEVVLEVVLDGVLAGSFDVAVVAGSVVVPAVVRFVSVSVVVDASSVVSAPWAASLGTFELHDAVRMPDAAIVRHQIRVDVGATTPV
jgi:hypothetical protein